MKLLRNFLFLSGGEALSKILSVVAIAYVARIAGPIGFGYLEFALSMVLLAGVLVHQGLGLYGAREIARDPALTDSLVAEVVSTRFALAGITYAGLVVIVYLADRPAVAEQLVLLYGLSLLLIPLDLQWVFQGHERMHNVAALQIARQAVFALGVFIFLTDGSRLWPVAIAEVAGVGAIAAGSIGLYRYQLKRWIRSPSEVPKKLIREGAVIGLSRLFWSVKIFGSTVMLGLIASEQDVGYFGAAMRVLIGLHVFTSLYFINLLPSLSREWSEHGSIQRQTAESMRVVSWLSLGAGALWIILSPAVIRLLYGDAFTPSVAPLQWLAVVCVLAAIHGHYRFGLISAGRQRDEMLTSALGMFVSLSLIPVGYHMLGVTGAALALVAGEFTVWASSWLFAHRLQLGGEMRFLVFPTICVAFLYVAHWFFPVQLPLAVQVTVVVLGLGAAAFLSDSEVRRSTTQVVSHWRAHRAKQ